jgi:hypothetical protein
MGTRAMNIEVRFSPSTHAELVQERQVPFVHGFVEGKS